MLRPLTGRIEFLDALPPGLTAVPAPGHTPGHTCLLVTDPARDERLLILGDLLHTRAQFTEPDWCFRSDLDPEQASRSRAGILARFTDPLTTLAACHFAPDPFGRGQRGEAHGEGGTEDTGRVSWPNS